eukprot:3640909-Rhodomonas_salina.1
MPLAAVSGQVATMPSCVSLSAREQRLCTTTTNTSRSRPLYSQMYRHRHSRTERAYAAIRSTLGRRRKYGAQAEL